jgi:shikimate kinase
VHDDSRPLLADGDRTETLTRLRDVRAEAYGAAAHLEVETDGRTQDEVAADVVARFREHHS